MGAGIEEEKSKHVTHYADGKRLESSCRWHFIFADRNISEVSFLVDFLAG